MVRSVVRVTMEVAVKAAARVTTPLGPINLEPKTLRNRSALNVLTAAHIRGDIIQDILGASSAADAATMLQDVTWARIGNHLHPRRHRHVALIAAVAKSLEANTDLSYVGYSALDLAVRILEALERPGKPLRPGAKTGSNAGSNTSSNTGSLDALTTAALSSE